MISLNRIERREARKARREIVRTMAAQMNVPIGMILVPQPQPEQISRRASRLRVRASRSLPYPTAKYAVRQETRDRVFEQTWDEGEKWGMSEDDARARARLGSGRREVFD